MHGYRPPKQDPEGSWREIFTITWVVLGLLAPPMLVIFGVLFLLGAAVWLLSFHLLFALVPIGVLGLGVWRLIVLDQRAHATLEEELLGRRRP